MQQSETSPNLSEIIRAFESGEIERANTLFEAAGGDQFAFQNGFESLGQVLAAMPPDHWRRNEAAFCSWAVYLCKFGQAARASGHLNDPDLEFHKTVRFTIVELLVAIHLGDPIDANDIERWIFVERALPISDPLTSGLYYNAMLAILVRVGRLSEARSFGARAISAFKAAQHAHLEHFIHLHLADLSINEGHLRRGRRHLYAAKACLEKSGEAHGNEQQLSEIVSLVLDYEAGNFAHIPARGAELRTSLIEGDSWAEIFNQLARITTLSLYFTAGRRVALSELAEFQVGYAQRHGRHSDVLAVLEIEIDRLDHSLGGAEQAIARLDPENLRGPVGSNLLSGIVAALGHQNAPSLPVAGPRAALNAALTEAAQLSGQARRRSIQQAFLLAVRESHVAPFVENRETLSGLGSQLTTSGFVRGHVQTGRMVRKVFRTVEHSYWVPERLRNLGVTHKQLRVLTALQSGATNKEIGRLLGLSEATVKFHLTKLYRATGVRKRGELIEITMGI